MAHTMKSADLLALAKKHGFGGVETDTEALKKHMAECGQKYADSAGLEIDFKNLTLEQEPAKVLTLDLKKAVGSEIESKQTGINPSDLKALVMSGVEDALKSAGVEPKRPGFGGAIRDVPVTVKSADEIIYEGNQKRGITAFKSVETARLWRDYFLAEVCGATPQYARHSTVADARKRLDLNPLTKAYATAPNAAGGALVWGEFMPDLLNNVLQYGVARRLAKVVPMGSESLTLPVKEGIHTLNYPQQGDTIPQSTGVTYRNVNLTAKDGSTIVKVTRRLLQDASLNFMDDAFKEIARCVAFTEDYELFMANAEAAYGNMVGIIPKFTVAGYFGNTITTAAGRVTGGGNWSGHTNAHLAELLGKIPQYARPNAVFTCTPEFQQVFVKLAQAQGGVTYKETEGYGYLPYYFGRPIIENNVMNSTADTATTTIDLLYGDFSRAALHGDRMGLEIDVSDQRYWDENNIGIRGIIRHDINVWDVGSTSRVGPIAYLYQS